jgi:hypothetical protein
MLDIFNEILRDELFFGVPMTPARSRWMLFAAVIVICVLVIVLPNPFAGPSYNAPFGELILATSISNEPQNMPLYRVVPQDNDMIDYWSVNRTDKSGNVTSEADAPQVALKILDGYGGLPEGAMLIRVETEYLEEMRSSGIPFIPSTVVDRIPESTVLNYGRSLGDFHVMDGYIRMELGKNDELLNFKKVWRTVTPVGTIPVIPATEALNKIQRGEIIANNHPRSTLDLRVDTVRLAYLENDYNESQDYLTPIWVFAGTLSQGGNFSYRVTAWGNSTPVTW